MFKTPTVFVLGAGASWHYGYPTGEDLVKRVIERAETLAAFFDVGARSSTTSIPKFAVSEGKQQPGLGPWLAARQKVFELSKRLAEVNPTLIDYFLAQNSDLQDVGRLVIASVIFDCERDFHARGGNPNHGRLLNRAAGRGQASPVQLNLTAFDDDWLRFVLYGITANCEHSEDLSNNAVRFVTFNYDMSLERRLFFGLSNISRFQAPDIDKFMSRDRVLHVYGKVRESIDSYWSPLKATFEARLGPGFDASLEDLDAIYEASKGIKTIDGPEKVENTEAIEKAKAALKNAEAVYILGFGFDQQNVSRIGLDLLTPNAAKARQVFFTNFGGHNRVGIAAGECFRIGRRSFIGNSFIDRDGIVSNKNTHWTYEMSTKNVYDALSQDFPSMEAV